MASSRPFLPLPGDLGLPWRGGGRKPEPRDLHRSEGTGMEIRNWCWKDLEVRFPLGITFGFRILFEVNESEVLKQVKGLA